MLKKLCSMPESKRDGEWEDKFLREFAKAKVKISNEEVIEGPDGWPYFYVETASGGTEPVDKVVEWASSRGVGLVVNADKQIPDYVFPYGMLWNFFERGEFLTAIEGDVDDAEDVSFKSGDEIMVGPPSQTHLPPYVADILLEFFEQQNVKDPRVLMISRDGENYDLCFSAESLGDPPADEHDGILEAIGWFLPSHYTLMLVSEKSLPDFYSLKSVADGSIKN